MACFTTCTRVTCLASFTVLPLIQRLGTAEANGHNVPGRTGHSASEGDALRENACQVDYSLKRV